MDRKEALTLTPKRLFSPITGKWIDLYCESLEDMSVYTQGDYKISCIYNGLEFSVRCECVTYIIAESNSSSSLILDQYEEFKKIEKNNDKYILRFQVDLTAKSHRGIAREICADCQYLTNCKLIEKIEKGDIIFEGYQYFDLQLEYIIEFVKEEKRSKSWTIENYLDTKVEFGLNKDKKLVSTIKGIAVMNENDWSVFDSNTNTITKILEVEKKNVFPIYIVPATKLEIGDLIKDIWDTGEYYYVTDVYESNVITVAAKDGKVKAINPLRDVREREYYVKLIAFMDYLDLGRDSNMMKLMMSMLMDKK